MRTVPILLGGGLLIYYLYSQGYFGHSATAAPAPSGSGTGGGTTPPPASTGTNPNSLAAVYARIKATVPSGTRYTPDQWSYYINADGSITAPDPVAVFGSDPSWDRTVAMGLDQFWAKESDWLAKNRGMSGMGWRGWIV